MVSLRHDRHVTDRSANLLLIAGPSEVRTIDTTVLRGLALTLLLATGACAATNAPPPSGPEELRARLERELSGPNADCTIQAARLELRRGLSVDGVRWTARPGSPRAIEGQLDRLHLAVPPHLVAALALQSAELFRNPAALLLPDPRALWPLQLEVDGASSPDFQLERLRFKRAATVELSLNVTTGPRTLGIGKSMQLGSGPRLTLEYRSDAVRTRLEAAIHVDSDQTAKDAGRQVARILPDLGRWLPKLSPALTAAKSRIEGRSVRVTLELSTADLMAQLAPARPDPATSAAGSAPEVRTAPVDANAPVLEIALGADEVVTEGPLPRLLEIGGEVLLPVPAGARVEVQGRALPALPPAAGAERLIAHALAKADPSVLAHLDRALVMLPRPLPARVKIAHRVEPAGALRHYTCPLIDRVEAASASARGLKLRITGAGHQVFSPTHGVQGVAAAGHPLVADLPAGAAGLELFVRPPLPAGASADPLVEVFSWDEEDGAGQLVALIAPGAEGRTKRLPSDVVFVVDVSGSMGGAKLESAKKALEACLTRLSPDDRFAVLKFSDSVEAFQHALVAASPAEVGRAVGQVRALVTEGGTNLEGGAVQGLELLEKADPGRSRLLLLLTDGQPSCGVTDEDGIVRNVAEKARGRVALHPVGIGADVNTRLMDRIAAQGGGDATYIRPEDDIEQALARLHASLAQPVATGVTVALSGARPVHLQPERPVELYRGGWLVATARYQARPGDTPELTVSGRTGAGPCTVVRSIRPGARRHAFVPALVAQRRLAALLEAARTAPLDPIAEEEVLTLSLAHGIETPLTRDILRARKTRSALGTDVTEVLDHTKRLRSRLATSFKAITGAQALEEAVSIGKLRTLAMASTATASSTQADRGGKRFVYRPGRGWVDIDYRGTGQTRTLTFGTPEYAAALAAEPQLGAWLSLGDRVTVATARGDVRVEPARAPAPPAPTTSAAAAPAPFPDLAPGASIEAELTACIPADVGSVAIPRAGELAALEEFLTGWDLGALKLWDAQRTYPRFLDDLAAQLGLDRRALAGRSGAQLDAGAVFLFADLGFSTASRLGVLVAPRAAGSAEVLLAKGEERTVRLEGEPVRAITAGALRSYRWTAPGGRVLLVANDPWIVTRVIRARRAGAPSYSVLDKPAAASVALAEVALQRVIGEAAGTTATPVCQALREKLARVQALYRADHPLAPANPDLERLQRGGYLPELPVCPAGGTLEPAARVECSVHTQGQSSEEAAPAGGPLPLRHFGLDFTPVAGGMQMAMEVTPGDAAAAEALAAFPPAHPLPAAFPPGAFAMAALDLAPYVDELSRPAKPDAEALVPGLAAGLARLEATTGITAARDVFPWLGRELAVALYATTARPDELDELPDVALTVTLTDPARARAFFEAQSTRIQALPAAGGARVRVERRTVPGGESWMLALPYIESRPCVAIAGAHLVAASDPATLDRTLAALAGTTSLSPRGAASAPFLAEPAHVTFYAETDRVPGLATLGVPAALTRTPVLAARVVFERHRIRSTLLAR